MPSTTAGATAVKDILAELESLGDEKRRQYNARVGPDGIAGAPPDKQFGCKTGDIRKLAKKIKTGHELGQKLWKTGNMDAQLLAILIMKPKELSAEQLDTMVREAPFTWVADWLQSYVIKNQPDDEKDLASRVLELYHDPGKRASVGAQAQAFYQVCQWPVMKHEYLKVYEELLAR